MNTNLFLDMAGFYVFHPPAAIRAHSWL